MVREYFLKKIKLLLIAPSFYPVHGGAGLRFYRYLPYFYENDIETTVICGTPKTKKFTDEDRHADWLQLQDGTLVADEVVEKAKVLKYKIPGSGAKKRCKFLLDKAIELCADQHLRPDIVHIIAPMPYAVTKQLKEIKKLGVKLIYSHTIAKKFSTKVFVKLMQKWTIKQVLKQYDHIIVQSQVLKELISETNPDSTISVIPNGVDIEKFSPVKNQQEKNYLRTSLGLPLDATIITLVGAIHPRKGTDLLVEAWSQLVKQYPQLNLVLIGPRYDQTREELLEFKEKIEQAIDQSGRKSNIYFLGELKQVDLYLKASDMFVFPSEREGMPNAVLEAMATGLPIVLTPFMGLSDELGIASEQYLLAERSCNSLREKILNLIEDKNLRESLSIKAREWIVNNMQINRNAEQYTNVFRESMRS